MNVEKIIKVLKCLDVNDDNLWTDNGLPRISVFKESITRAEITAAAPEFYRENLVVPENILSENIKTDEIKIDEKEVERNDVDNDISASMIDIKENREHELNIIDADILKVQQDINQKQYLLNDLKNEKNKLKEKILIDHPPLNSNTLIQEHIKSEYKIRLKSANANAEILKEIRDKVPGAMRSVLDKALLQKASQRIVRPVYPVLKNATA